MGDDEAEKYFEQRKQLLVSNLFQSVKGEKNEKKTAPLEFIVYSQQQKKKKGASTGKKSQSQIKNINNNQYIYLNINNNNNNNKQLQKEIKIIQSNTNPKKKKMEINLEQPKRRLSSTCQIRSQVNIPAPRSNHTDTNDKNPRNQKRSRQVTAKGGTLDLSLFNSTRRPPQSAQPKKKAYQSCTQKTQLLDEMEGTNRPMGHSTNLEKTKLLLSSDQDQKINLYLSQRALQHSQSGRLSQHKATFRQMDKVETQNSQELFSRKDSLRQSQNSSMASQQKNSQPLRNTPISKSDLYLEQQQLNNKQQLIQNYLEKQCNQGSLQKNPYNLSPHKTSAKKNTPEGTKINRINKEIQETLDLFNEIKQNYNYKKKTSSKQHC